MKYTQIANYNETHIILGSKFSIKIHFEVHKMQKSGKYFPIIFIKLPNPNLPVSNLHIHMGNFLCKLKEGKVFNLIFFSILILFLNKIKLNQFEWH